VPRRPCLTAWSFDPKPQFDISPYLYMQFMEPLGVTDSSVEGAWDWADDDWRKDFVDVVKDLAPDVIRWGGRESNRIGTHEFIDLCRRVGAEPLWCVNFLADGR
jgi:alpha-L-arabinofuranosidase